VDRFLSLQLSISSGLSVTELDAMKFLCRDRIKKRKLETAQSALELFSSLMEQQVIARDRLGFLKELLQHISRGDLLSLVVQFEEEELDAPDDQPDEHEKPVGVICANVGREWKKLMRELGLSEVTLDRIEAAYRFDLGEELFQALRKWEKLKGKDAKVADLINALRECSLNLVADRVEE
ncbi:FADD protein, partial [Irena cyanogastra]|nr:FADD protein [Irena cyanogastra]